MATVRIKEATAQLSKLIQRALEGEEIIIAKGKTPLVKLTPLPSATKKRTLGTQEHFVRSIAPNFDECLEEFDPYFQ